jgi:hypothetical protein
MSNQFYNHTTYPQTGSSGSSASLRAELESISSGFDKLPVLTGNANKLVKVSGSEAVLDTLTAPTGAIVGTTDTQTLTNKTLVATTIAAATNTITTAASGNLTSTELNAALAELQTDVDTRSVASTTTSALNLKVDKTTSTGSAVLPVGTSAQRDAVPTAGLLRFNSDLVKPEVYTGSAWGSVGGGATGGGTDAVFYLNGQTITSNYTIPAGQNAGSFGSITIADGISATIPTGSTWSIV